MLLTDDFEQGESDESQCNSRNALSASGGERTREREVKGVSDFEMKIFTLLFSLPHGSNPPLPEREALRFSSYGDYFSFPPLFPPLLKNK